MRPPCDWWHPGRSSVLIILKINKSACLLCFVQMVRFRRHCWEDYSIVVTDSVMISVIFSSIHCVFSTHEYSPRLVFSNSQQNKCVFEACLLEAPLGPLWRRHLFTFNARGCVVDSRPQKLFYRLVMVINYSFFMVHIIQERVQNVTCSQ